MKYAQGQILAAVLFILDAYIMSESILMVIVFTTAGTAVLG
jgi:hypothetical protein